MSESFDTVDSKECNANPSDNNDQANTSTQHIRNDKSNDLHSTDQLGLQVPSGGKDEETNNLEDDFDDFTEFACASDDPIVHSSESQVDNNQAAINEEKTDFADFSKCDTSIEEAKVNPFPLNEMSRVFISTFTSSADDESSSSSLQESSHSHVEPHGKHSNHLLTNSSSLWQSLTSTQKKLKWQTSHAFKLFLASLNINPAQMHNGVPIFAADLGLLQPIKSCSSDAINTSSCSTANTCSESNQKRINGQPSFTSSEKSASSSVTEGKIEESIVQSSLSTTLELTPDSLDFLDECSNSTQETKVISSLEEELLADMNVTSDQSNNHSIENCDLPVIPTDEILHKLLINSKASTVRRPQHDNAVDSCSPHQSSLDSVNNSTHQSSIDITKVICLDGSNYSINGSHDESNGKIANPTTLSPEAAQILDELPLLAFLRKKITPSDNSIF